jgi:hypothetical protein
MPNVVVESPRNGRQFVHLSFRIPENVRRELNREAKRQHVNLNALANRVLAKYVDFDRIVEHEHSIILDRRIFLPIIEAASREDLENLGKALGPRLVKQTFEFFDIEPTVESLVSRYFEPMGAYSGRYQSNIVGSGPDLKLILEHDYGIKWSAFLAEYTRGVVKSLLGTEPKIELDDDLIKIEFRPGTTR